MKRRELLALISSAAAWPLAARVRLSHHRADERRWRAIAAESDPNASSGARHNLRRSPLFRGPYK
jgi:hypothetical protein